MIAHRLLRLDRSPGEIEAAERQLVRVLGASGVEELLDVQARPEHEAIIDEITILPPSMARGSSVPRIVEKLLAFTVPGSRIDPRQLGGDLPWAALVVWTANDDLDGARSISTKWFAHLDRLRWEDEDVHPLSLSTAAYMTMEIEILRGRFSSASRWARLADVQVEAEEPAGIEIVAWLRAAKLWMRFRDSPRTERL